MATPLSLTEEELSSAVELLQRVIPAEDFPAYSLEVSPATVYTTLVTLWMLTLQRLGGGRSMAAVVQEVLSYHRDLLPDNKRVREGTLSEKSGAYSQARKRLPLSIVRAFAERVSQSLIDQSPPWLTGRRAFLIDGTTITLPPTSNLREVYPPAVNQQGATVWPVLMLMVAHELQSGCALIPELGAMYGPDNTSEARQAAAIGRRIPPGSLVLADAGFGIFSVAYALVEADQDILFRLSKPRYQALRRRAQLIEQTPRGTHSRVCWSPSAKDRQTNPDLPPEARLTVELHEVRLAGGELLYLATTLPVSSATAAEYYGRRYDVEHDIRDFKVTLGLEEIRARSVEMVQKELLCSVVAYNLVVELRRQAAKLKRIPPRRLSFTGVWTTMQNYLLRQPPCSAAEWQTRYERALKSASNATLPNRSNRSYPRRAHPRRPKSTKFMQLPTEQNAANTPPQTPK